MNFLKKIGIALGIIPENKTEEINKERENQKNTLAVNLVNMGFNQDEVNEVLSVIIEAEKKIQEQKDLLIGTNINVDDVNLTMKPIFDEIKRLQQKLAVDVRTKIQEIRQRKENSRN